MKTFMNYIELSADRAVRSLCNPGLSVDEGWEIYKGLLENAETEFKKIYGVHFVKIGTGDRRICVENTPQNRINHYRMTRTIKRLQRQLIHDFNTI